VNEAGPFSESAMRKADNGEVAGPLLENDGVVKRQ